MTTMMMLQIMKRRKRNGKLDYEKEEKKMVSSFAVLFLITH